MDDLWSKCSQVFCLQNHWDNPGKQIKVFSSIHSCPDGDSKTISELSVSRVIEAGFVKKYKNKII
jgi:hypothetical protein